jgi:hypothetical protein
MDRQGNLSRTECANCRRSAVARRDDRGVIALEPDDLQSVRRGPIDLQTETSRDLIEFMMHRLREAFGEQAGHAKGERRGLTLWSAAANPARRLLVVLSLA